MNHSRLDLLIYAHDGRGLGHASRSIAIGMAVRRLYPDLKVLFITGSRMASQLIGSVPLDWLKLPAYKTRVVDGVSTGRTGFINLTDAELGACRQNIIRHLVQEVRPRCVLADHSPQGKHRELVPALEATRGTDTAWVLGVRGWVGGVPQVWSDTAGSLFAAFYRDLLWYGDSRLLGEDHIKSLGHHFSTKPVETGYVCRIAELDRWLKGQPAPEEDDTAGVVSIPWIGERTGRVTGEIMRALRNIGPGHGKWRLFIGSPDEVSIRQELRRYFDQLPFCEVRAAGGAYRRALLTAKAALIYGGYNSLTDVFYANIPAVVLLRDMQDEEQQAHLRRLSSRHSGRLTVVDEKDLSAENLAPVLLRMLHTPALPPPEVNLEGAASAARRLHAIITSGE